MADNNELLLYKGNPDSGLGSTSSIPVSNGEPLDFVNQTITNIGAREAAKNILLYKQKIQDRDNLYQALSDGSVKVGATLEQDLPKVRAALDDQTEAFKNWMKKGYGDIDGAINYKKATEKANEVATIAQARKKFSMDEQAAAATDTFPSHRQARLDNLNNVLSNFNGDIKPYQPVIDWNHDEMTAFNMKDALVDKAGIAEPTDKTTQWTSVTNKDGKIITKHTEKTVPGKATQQKVSGGGGMTVTTPNGEVSLFDTVPGKYIDYTKILANAADGYMHEEKQQINQGGFFKSFQEQPAAEALPQLAFYNKRIQQYNDERGFSAGDPATGVPPTPGYVQPINGVVDNTGQVHLAETPTSFSAKTTLASVPGNFVQQDEKVLNKEAANYLVAKEKADSDAVYKRAMAASAGLRAHAYAANLYQQMGLRKTDAEKDQFLEDMYRRNLVNQPSLIKGVAGKPNEVSMLQGISAQSSLPVFTLEGNTVKQLVPIDSKAVYSPASYTDPADPTTLKPGSKPIRYEGGYYKPTYRIGGQPVDVDRIGEIYGNFKKQQGSSWKGSMDDFIKQAIQAGKIDVLMTGANGTTDEQLSKAAQRIIANKATKKGQEEPFSIEYSEDVIPDNNQ